MLILPAIDLQGGRCVRLRQGRFDEATIYHEDPFAQLEAFAAAGAEWVHVVDLDGAQAGAPVQHALLSDLARVSSAKLQTGGGVRGVDAVTRLLDHGVARVVIGSSAARAPEMVRTWLDRFGVERICCAFDLRRSEDGAFEVALDGWSDGGGLTIADALALYPPDQLKHVLVTDISRDGVLTGPNLPLIAELVALRPDLHVQASGGVASLADLAALRNAGASAAIIGRALYERCFSLEDALAG